MAENSKIEWTDTTWSVVLGCDRVSAGCDSCYAIPQARMRAANPNPKVAAAFAGLAERTPGRLDWTGRVNQLPDRLIQPLRWRKPRKIFVNSLSDMFHDKIEADFIAQVFAVISLADQHVFQMLTKRHGRMRSLLNEPDFVAVVDNHRERIRPGCGDFVWPIPNLHLGVSCEDQRWADIRIPALMSTPAAVRWISAEPLLGPLNIRRWINTGRLDWIVAGGESGPGARPMHPDWARSIRDQAAVEADVPFLFKQWGEWAPGSAPLDSKRMDATVARDDGQTFVPAARLWAETPVADRDRVNRKGWAMVHRAGKKAAGRELDGRTWDEYPQPAEVTR